MANFYGGQTLDFTFKKQKTFHQLGRVNNYASQYFQKSKLGNLYFVK